MTERQDALCDHSFAAGMLAALRIILDDMNGGPERVRVIAKQMSGIALKSIIATRGEKEPSR